MSFGNLVEKVYELLWEANFIFRGHDETCEDITARVSHHYDIERPAHLYRHKPMYTYSFQFTFICPSSPN